MRHHFHLNRPKFLPFILGAALALPACNCGDASYITQRSPPLVNVANDVVDFGPLPVGYSVVRQLRVLNAGGENLEVSLRIDGPPGFVLEQASREIAPTEDWELAIRFAPAEEREYAATLVITSNDEQRPQLQVSLRGEGTPNQVCGACDDPPADYCATESALVRHDEAGFCVDGACQYNVSVQDCALGCNDSAGICFGDAVTDPDGGTDVDLPAPDAGDMNDDAGQVDLADAGSGEDELDVPHPPCPVEYREAEVEVVSTCPGQGDLTEPGNYRIVIPAGCSQMQVDLWGAGGGGGAGVSQGLSNLLGGHGGGGAYVGATLDVSAGEIIRIRVGQGGAAGGCASPPPGGWPGGGRGGLARENAEGGNGGGGGGHSTLVHDGAEVLVAAGGGGGGGHGWGSSFIAGGGGPGGPAGTPGTDLERTNPGICAEAIAEGGRGALPQGGGAGGSGVFPGTGGSLAQGGAGGDFAGEQGDPGGGGGGGGGTFGGGGGGATWHCNASGAGGGGGASRGDLREAGDGRLSGRAGSSALAGTGGRGGYAVIDVTEAGEAGRAGKARIVFSP